MVLGADSAYVINLERHKIRKKRFDHLINKLHLTNINYIEGVDKKDLGPDTWGLSKDLWGEYFWDPNGYCTMGILCCALSHRKAYKAFLDSGDEVGLFLEDDIRNTSFLHKLDFTEIRKELDSIDNWGVAVYGRYEKDILRGKQITSNFYESLNHKKQYSGHAYLLNRKSAQWFYDRTEKIEYAADIRLEISPFNIITLDKSIFVQRHRDYGDFETYIKKGKGTKYEFLKEFSSTTTAECNDKDHREIWKHDLILISKYVPAVSYIREDIKIRGKSHKWVKIKMGDQNKVFYKRKTFYKE